MDTETIAEAFANARAAITVLADLPTDRMTAPQLLDVAAHLEDLARLIPGAERVVVNRLAELGTESFGGGRLGMILADRLRITPTDAAGRIHTAADVAPRTAVTGESMPPILPHTAAAEKAGSIGPGHVKVIRDFYHHLPASVDVDARDRAEKYLVEVSTRLRPDDVRRCAHRLTAHLAPDDEYTDRDRARTRYFRLGPQEPDKMRSGSFRIDPQLGAMLETLFGKLAAPGMCHPDHERPVVDGVPDPEAIAADTRSPAQRRHDALAAICREVLAVERLGSHRGLPVTVIATATLNDLHNRAGMATTGSGALLPMRDLIRLAARTTPYLAVFDNHEDRPLYLGRGRRLATPDQRVLLHALDRGCTFPGCPTGAGTCETHHLREWSDGGATDIDNLTLVCPTHHRMIGRDPTRWRAGRNRGGRTEWTPPHHIDPTGTARTNTYHRAADERAWVERTGVERAGDERAWVERAGLERAGDEQAGANPYCSSDERCSPGGRCAGHLPSQTGSARSP